MKKFILTRGTFPRLPESCRGRYLISDLIKNLEGRLQMNLPINKYFISDASQKVVLSNGNCRLYYLGEPGEGRTQMARNQVILKPAPLDTVFFYIN